MKNMENKTLKPAKPRLHTIPLHDIDLIYTTSHKTIISDVEHLEMIPRIKRQSVSIMTTTND